MNKRQVNIILSEHATMPSYATPLSSGADLYSANDSGIVIPKGGIKLIPTGIRMELPEDAEGQIRPRSGLRLKKGIIAVIGTIDADYQGEIGIVIQNCGDSDFVVYKGERLAQIVFNGAGGLFQAEFNKVEEFTRDSERGEGGFGHTGTK